MTGRQMGKNLFGKTVKRKRTRIEILLSKQDRESLSARVERINYLRKIIPKSMGLMGSMDLAFVFQEAKLSYVNGQFIATLLLAQAFIEKVIQSQMEVKGYSGTNRGLKYMVKYCRDKNLLPSVILDKIDYLRNIRNPFTHVKPDNDPYHFSIRIYQKKMQPYKVLENDAREAISTMLTVLVNKVL